MSKYIEMELLSKTTGKFVDGYAESTAGIRDTIYNAWIDARIIFSDKKISISILYSEYKFEPEIRHLVQLVDNGIEVPDDERNWVIAKKATLTNIEKSKIREVLDFYDKEIQDFVKEDKRNLVLKTIEDSNKFVHPYAYQVLTDKELDRAQAFLDYAYTDNRKVKNAYHIFFKYYTKSCIFDVMTLLVKDENDIYSLTLANFENACKEFSSSSEWISLKDTVNEISRIVFDNLREFIDYIESVVK